MIRQSHTNGWGVGFALLLVPLTSACRDGAVEAPPVDAAIAAHVVSVKASGEPGTYRFAVGVRSPDTGCEQYANWWEVLSEDGRLLFRRILAHSHVNEQPFVRGGGPVDIDAETAVWVRAHLHPTGYGGTVFRGTVKHGFQAAELPASFAAELAREPPLPSGCAS